MSVADSAPSDEDLIRSELKDKVTDLEGLLLALEQALRDGKPPIEALHLILRHAHSLKGTLGLAEKGTASRCVHAMENLFIAARDGRMTVVKEVFDLAFATLDRISLLAESYKEDEPALLDLVGKWTALGESSQGQGARSLTGIPFPLSPDEATQLRKALASPEQRLYLVAKSIVGGLVRADYDSLPIYDDIRSVGTLLSRHPRFEDLDTRPKELVLFLLVATALDADALKREIFDPFQRVELSDADRQRYLSEPAHAVAMTTAGSTSAASPTRLRTLIVEDDFTSRLMLQKFLAPFGEAHVAVDGEEALAAVGGALSDDTPYDLICLDIMMPKLDGQTVLRTLRQLEEDHQRPVGKGAKVVMTTCLKDSHNIMGAFREQCDAYLVKPIARAKLIEELRRLGLVAA